ncbi:MAG TPA: diiron oxygenase [Streptosporangiaceae bacterium]|jgi:hypothetical protein
MTVAAGRARLAEALRSLSGTVERLSALSQRDYQNPYRTLEWPDSVDPDSGWFTSPELISLYGTDFYGQLGESSRRRLSFYEAANFYSLNIHGEKTLMQGLASRLYRRDLIDVAPYLHHFLDEENKHSVYFGGFCTRYAHVYRSRQVALAEEPRRDVADFLFFGKVMIFEEIADHFNRLQARDERLHPVARFINHNHHVEESRHLAFGRRLVQALWQACAPDWDGETRARIRDQLASFFTMSWREYYNPDVYADAGLPGAPDPWELSETAWSSQPQRSNRSTASRKCLRFLTSIDVLDREPPDVF